MSFWKKIFGVTPPPPDSARNMSRNATCWCGSGNKYKHCHFEADRQYFTTRQNEVCKGPT
ncbi:hypothetical protein DRQ50_01960 [bacterium]|nr:MAG: hypothetical protein DRQ50_01960 [bacterium]